MGELNPTNDPPALPSTSVNVTGSLAAGLPLAPVTLTSRAVEKLVPTAAIWADPFLTLALSERVTTLTMLLVVAEVNDGMLALSAFVRQRHPQHKTEHTSRQGHRRSNGQG